MLGTGTPAPNPYRNGAGFVVISNGYPYFFDCGEGTWRGMGHAAVTHGDWVTKAFDVKNMKYLFLTHLHCDHTVGILSWILNAYKYGSETSKEIYGPVGTKNMIDHIMAAWVIDIADIQVGTLGYSPKDVTAAVHEIDRDSLVFEDANVKIYAYRKYHGDIKDNFAYRVECADGRIFAFTGDGFYCPGTITAAKGADVVFVEAFSKESVNNAIWASGNAAYKTHAYHLWPEEIVLIQKNTNPGAIVLIHEQDFTAPKDYTRTGLLEECKRAGVEGVLYNGVDGDVRGTPQKLDRHDRE